MSLSEVGLVPLAHCPGMGVASAPMNIRTIVIAVAVLALGGYALYDYYSVYGCFALDALSAEGSKDSVAAMESALGNKDKARKNIYLGALYRLMNTSGWKTNAQLAQMLPAETEWEAKELMLEYIRHH